MLLLACVQVHPCIIGWSLGNESGYGSSHDEMASWIRERDSSRAIFYEPASYGPRSGDNGSRTKPAAGAPLQAVASSGTGVAGTVGAAWAGFAGGLAATVFGPGAPAAPTAPAGVLGEGPLLATDVLCPMYARVEDCITLANSFPDMPLILCEYAHMMGK